MSDVYSALGHHLPRPTHWRIVQQPRFGYILGLPTFTGIEVATDGIWLLLRRTAADGSLSFRIGHVDWFIPYTHNVETDELTPPTDAEVAARKQPKAKVLLDYTLI
jgi:hypothetical protein